MNHDDRSDLICSFCGRTRRGVRKLSFTGSLICEECAVCSFCGKAPQEVQKLIAGPKVLICDECIALCADIIEEEVVGEWLARVGKDLRTVCDLDRHATTLAVRARHFAESCDRAVALPRPTAERARALADEIELFASADAGSRVVFTDYANVVAATARSFAKTCDTLELPGHVAQRARALSHEIEALVGARDGG